MVHLAVIDRIATLVTYHQKHDWLRGVRHLLTIWNAAIMSSSMVYMIHARNGQYLSRCQARFRCQKLGQENENSQYNLPDENRGRLYRRILPEVQQRLRMAKPAACCKLPSLHIVADDARAMSVECQSPKDSDDDNFWQA
jgi:hypothetical protein